MLRNDNAGRAPATAAIVAGLTIAGGPRGLPAPIVATLHDAFKNAMFDPQFVNEIAKYDQETDYLGPVEYGQWLREQYARERAAVERMGLSRGGT